MWRKCLLLLLMALVLAACNGESASKCTSNCVTVNSGVPMTVGSNVKKSEVRAVANFTAVRLAGAGKVVIEQTGAQSVTVTADDNLLALFTTGVEDGVLVLGEAQGKSFTGKQPYYKITVADVRMLALSGSGEMQAGRLDGAALSISVAGSGDVTAAGRVGDLTVSISGSGSVKAAGLTAKRAKVTVIGSGDATVNASDELDATMSGSGRIWYLGSPTVKTSKSGSGSIEKKSN